MPRDQVRATPRSAPLGALADFLAKSYSPERTQQMQGVAKFLDIPAISETLNRLSYGEPLTTGAGGLGGTTRFRPEVLDATIAVAPGAGALGRLAAQGTMATGRAVPRIMGRGGMGPQAEALRLAQQRAALPPSKGGLGLPANNTAQQRARAMNFEERGFHETEGANIESGLTNFDVRRAGAAASDEQTPYAMFIKPNPSGIGIARNNPAQMPLMVKSNLTDENILKSFSNREELQRYLDQFPEIKKSTRAVSDLDNQMANYMDELSNKMDKRYAERKTEEADKIYKLLGVDSPLMKEFYARINELSANSKEQITDLFKSQGVGTVGLQNDAGAFGRKTITEMVLDPNENVRSRFAAFDPFRRTAAIAATMGVAAPDLMAKEMDEEIPNQPPEYQSGGVVKLLQNMLVKSGEKALTAAQRAEAGRAAAALIKSQEQVKASEALGQQMEKGMKRTTTTQADRTRVGGGNIGGAPFSAISEADPAYAGKVWGVMDSNTAKRLTNLTTPETAWTTMLGSANQLKTNPIVFDKLKRQFIDSMKQGNLSPELEAKINHNLALTFGEGAQIRDPKIWRQADTFEKRAALADLMMGQGIQPSKGGVALGGEKSGKGVIFRPTDTLKRETEPSLLHTEHGGDVPTFAAGPRLFKLEKESVYRPDLHPGFPTLLTGKDLNVNMIPTPTEIYLPDWHKQFKKNNPDRKPSYYDLALGVKGEGLPSQDLNDEYIRHLLREGFAEGGAVHMDEGGAAFGVFPQMKARRAKQDREAAANAPLSALRGYAAGTAGLPGDIEGLARMAMSQIPSQFLNAMPALRAFGIGSRANPTPQLPTTEFYNEYLPGAQLNQTPTGKAFTTAGNVLGGTGSTTIAGLGAKSTAELANLAARIAAESPRAGSRAAQLGVIKMPGGNFLKGDIEDAVGQIKNNRADEANYMKFVRTQNELGDDYKNWILNKIEQDPNFFKMPAIDTANMFLRENKQPLLPLDQINTFIDKKIVPYIKNEMATPGDPLRAMAEKYAVDKPAKLAEVQGRIDAFAAKMEQTARERGVPVGDLTSMRQQMIGLEKEKALVEARQALHTYNPEDALHGDWLPEQVASMRIKAGFPEEGVGVSPTARAWENASDAALNVAPASKHTRPLSPYEITRGIRSTVDTNPWLLKVPPETPVYYPERGLSEDLGFNHLVDELRNATNPESGLPKNLLIDPADLSKLTMPKAVELVADINAWRATQKAEADLLRANNAATQVVKEYPEQGMKWVELKTPEAKLPEGVSVVKYGDLYHVVDDVGNSLSVGATEKEALNLLSRSERETTLADALKYEGDTMAHCVGGYCPDVVEGRSRIYSLRDDKGQPRVTIEVQPKKAILNLREIPDDVAEQLNAEGKRLGNEQSDASGYSLYGDERDIQVRTAIQRLKDDWAYSNPVVTQKITQIKGKGNRKPADEFLPFVQDFVKSGNWSDVGDLQNTGLYSAKDVMNYMPETFTMSRNARQLAVGRARQAQDLPDYMTKAEYEAMLQKHAPEDIWRAEKAQNAAEDDELLRQLRPPPEGFAQGGMVSSNHFDPIKIKQIIASLDDDYDPQRIQQIIAHQESSYA